MKAKELARREREKRTDERKSGIVTVKNAVAFFPPFVRSFFPSSASLPARGLCQDGKARRPTEQRRPTDVLTGGGTGVQWAGNAKEKARGKEGPSSQLQEGQRKKRVFFHLTAVLRLPAHDLLLWLALIFSRPSGPGASWPERLGLILCLPSSLPSLRGMPSSAAYSGARRP